jgi:hypothetical protein
MAKEGYSPSKVIISPACSAWLSDSAACSRSHECTGATRRQRQRHSLLGAARRADSGGSACWADLCAHRRRPGRHRAWRHPGSPRRRRLRRVRRNRQQPTAFRVSAWRAAAALTGQTLAFSAVTGVDELRSLPDLIADRPALAASGLGEFHCSTSLSES